MATDFKGNTSDEMKLPVNKYSMGPIDINLMDFGQ